MEWNDATHTMVPGAGLLQQEENRLALQIRGLWTSPPDTLMPAPTGPPGCSQEVMFQVSRDRTQMLPAIALEGFERTGVLQALFKCCLNSQMDSFRGTE